jgi:hypothetical protein
MIEFIEWSRLQMAQSHIPIERKERSRHSGRSNKNCHGNNGFLPKRHQHMRSKSK